jgi:hypothetical protein
VDVALVLAVDISRSMDLDEQRLQRDGYVQALRSPIVQKAISSGALGRIAVMYLEWSGPYEQLIVVPWSILDGPDSVNALADKLEKASIGRFQSTSISGAIDTSVRYLETSGLIATRRVIDISGDGPNNTGRAVVHARDEAVKKGIVINGLPFMVKVPTGFGDIENLHHYYEDCVVGGQGAFVIPIRDRTEILEATRTKLLREIADLRDESPRIHRAQAREKSNCLIGEMRRRDWMRH